MRLSPPEFRKARIEIVPMIDTIFFLLVFFMIASLSMVKLNSKKVSLPMSETAIIKPGPQITLTVDKEGLFLVNKQTVKEADLIAKMKQLLDTDPEALVVLNCDKDLPVAYFTRAYDDAKKAGSAHVLIATAARPRRVQ